MTKKVSTRDLELLSAYLDNQLSSGARARLEAHLKARGELRTALEDLRRTRALLRSLPRMRAPRNFTLNVEVASSIRPVKPGPRLYPAFRLASALASILLVIVLAGDLLGGSLSASRLIAVESPVGEVAAVQIETEAGQVTEQPAAKQSLPEATVVSAPGAAAPAEEALRALGAASPTTQTLAASAPSGIYPPPAEPPAQTPTETIMMADASQITPTLMAQVEPETQEREALPAAEPEQGSPAWSIWRLVEAVLAMTALAAGVVAIYLRRVERL
jgi:anti-sigma factor RsiW